ncbi:lipopolysaccharide biosynthesis protein [Saccharothrix sp. HUAS TT1]|uniref:lipopolysaccharide biosynthesis protein n=1 Tax=unclassified Saccharothrix TaxID=2593673 RepID=UPI00345BAE9B
MSTSMSLRRLFSPPVQMAAGLGVFGLAGYLFVALTGHTLSTDQANLAVTLYFVVNVIGPGVFAALEQVTSRAASSAVASGQAVRTVVGRVCASGGGLVAVVVAALLLLAPFLVDRTLGGDWALFAEVLATPVLIAALSVVRGLLAGLQRFSGYAMTLTVEGGVRLALCGLLVVLQVSDAWLFGLAYLGGSVLATLVGLVWLRGVRSAPDTATAAVPPMGKGLAALAVATLLAQLLPNLAPLAVSSRLPLDSVVALAFGQAVVVARIPLLLVFPIQTMLLPSLTAAATKGDYGFVARRVKLALAVLSGLGVVYAVGFTLLGPWLLRTFMGTRVDPDTVVTVLLAVSTVILIAAFAAQPALVALRRDKTITLGWAVGSAVTLAMVALPGDPPFIAALAQTVGPSLTLLVMLLGLRSALRQASAQRVEETPLTRENS